jgi:acyl-CoA dehydrogenase
MQDAGYLGWPFFAPDHRDLAGEIERWAQDALPALLAGDDEHDPRACFAVVRRLVAALGAAGALRACVAAAYGGRNAALDLRSLCLVREILARHSGLADFAFAMQGLGSVPISLAGSAELQRRYLPEVAAGRAIAAFALSEAEAGSDVAAIAMTATSDGEAYRLDGTKTWISNAGIADFYVVFARTGEGPGAKGLSAFVVDADTPGFAVTDAIEVVAPHPLGSLRLTGCRIGKERLLGRPGDGFRIAMATLDVFRSTVGAAALGFARRALAEAVGHCIGRRLFGQTLADFQLVQAKIADMAVAIDAAALLVYRAAWTKDSVGGRVTREASMAKLFATEAAQRVIDQAVQIFGGRGVVRGVPVERLYREIRALRIYEGASELQQLIIAKTVLDAARNPPAP